MMNINIKHSLRLDFVKKFATKKYGVLIRV